MKATPTKKRARRADSYMELIQTFPLRPICNTNDRDAAGNVLEKLVMLDERKTDRGQKDYLAVLSDLIEDYDAVHHAMPDDDRTPQQRLAYLVEQSGIQVSQLAKILGCSKSLVSLILSGKRAVSKENVVRLAKYFRMDAGYFL